MASPVPGEPGPLPCGGAPRRRQAATTQRAAPRERVIRPVVAAADGLLARRGHTPLPEGVTAHKLRHTFASILYVRGEDPAYVMAQLGHTDPGFPLRLYARAMRRDDGE